MTDQSPYRRFLTGGLDAYGVVHDEVDLAIADAIWEIYRDPLRRLMTVDLTDVEPEPDLDLSRAPRA